MSGSVSIFDDQLVTRAQFGKFESTILNDVVNEISGSTWAFSATPAAVPVTQASIYDITFSMSGSNFHSESYRIGTIDLAGNISSNSTVEVFANIVFPQYDQNATSQTID